MKKLNKTLLLGWLTAIAPVILVAVVYNMLPERVPIHWGVSGAVDGYGDKSTLLWIAAISPALMLLFELIPRIDPRRKNYEKFAGVYGGFRLIMMLFFLGVTAVTVSESINPGRISVSMVVTASLGLLFVFIGNMMPKIKSNFFAGIRTPWALSNTDVWNKTHRLGGYMFFFGGMAIVLAAFFMERIVLFVFVTLVAVLIAVMPAAMSYVWYKTLTRGEKGEEM